MVGCGPKPPEMTNLPVSTTALPVPYEISVDAQNERAVIYWAIDRAPGKPISGYNIYLSETPLYELFPNWGESRPEPYNHAPYPGDTDGDISRESFEIPNLENGKTFYVSVRTAGLAGAESDPSEEVKFVPLAKGEFLIADNHLSDYGGFSFDENISVPARDPRCDLYLYAKKDVVGLSSPSRLSAGLRKTGFTARNGKDSETLKIKTGDKLSVKTVNGRAEITIKKIGHVGTEVAADIEYIFYPDSDDR